MAKGVLVALAAATLTSGSLISAESVQAIPADEASFRVRTRRVRRTIVRLQCAFV